MAELLRHKYDESKPDQDLDSGLSSVITWPQLEAAMKSAFNIKPYETLVGIIVTDEGITARVAYIAEL